MSDKKKTAGPVGAGHGGMGHNVRPFRGQAVTLQRGSSIASGSEVDPFSVDADANDTAPEFSDEHLALEFAKQHAHHLRHVGLWNKWMWWTGRQWQREETYVALNLARRVCRRISRTSDSDSTAKQVASSKTVWATLALAKADRRLAATVDQWDCDPWVLNTPSGIVDLRTGKISAYDPQAYLTQITAIAPGGKCPMFLRFLEEITAGDEQLQMFLQRMLGYCLTGSTQEHALFFLYGTGANGKSVLINTVSGIMGDYHRTSAIDTFTASNQDRHPTELACLHGRRLVTATETEEGRRWAESRIKSLTGGDTVSARFMRADFFEYTPAFKLVIAGNHKPGLRSVDEAIRRRFHLVPFTVTIPEEKRDPELSGKLKAEWPGILQWMIDGCAAWREQGLNPPKAVKEATRAYLEAQDAMSAWIEDECDLDPNAWERSANLFYAWRTWAEKSGEPYGDIKRFSERLEARGIEYKRKHSGVRGFQGIHLKG